MQSFIMNYKLTELTNKLRLLTVSMPQLESVAVTVWIKTGSRNEEEKISGMSHFLEHIVFKGTHKRPTPEIIASELDGMGAESNAATSREWTQYYVKVRSSKLEAALEILSDLLLHPLFKPSDVEKEKGVIIEEIAMKEDVPMDKVGENFVELMFGKHALGRDVAGTKETVTGILKNDIEVYKDTQYVSENMLISIAGGFDASTVQNLVQKYFGEIKSGSLKTVDPFTFAQNKPQLHVENKKSEQAHLVAGFVGHERSYEQRTAETLLATILGKGMSSRLFLEVREKRSLAYAVGSSVSRYIDTGIFDTYAGVDVTKAEEALKVILEEHWKLRDGTKPIKKEELTKAKEYLKGRLALGLEDTTAVNGFFAQQALFLDEIQTPDEVFAKIDEVTVEDILKIARELFVPEKLNVALIGPFESKEKFEKIING